LRLSSSFQNLRPRPEERACHTLSPRPEEPERSEGVSKDGHNRAFPLAILRDASALRASLLRMRAECVASGRLTVVQDVAANAGLVLRSPSAARASRRTAAGAYRRFDPRFANGGNASKSPRIRASFFARDQPLIWRSAAIASVMRSNHCEKTSRTGVATPCNRRNDPRCAPRHVARDPVALFPHSRSRRRTEGCKHTPRQTSAGFLQVDISRIWPSFETHAPDGACSSG